MATRVSAAEVREIVDVDSSISDLTPFIEMATLIVDEELDDSGIGHTDARLKQIELLLAAHFVCIRDPRVGNEKAGPVGASYQYKLGLGLQVTTYGQQAMMMDSSGKLAEMNNKKGRKAASLKTIRTKEWENTTDYDS